MMSGSDPVIKIFPKVLIIPLFFLYTLIFLPSPVSATQPAESSLRDITAILAKYEKLADSLDLGVSNQVRVREKRVVGEFVNTHVAPVEYSYTGGDITINVYKPSPIRDLFASPRLVSRDYVYLRITDPNGRYYVRALDASEQILRFNQHGIYTFDLIDLRNYGKDAQEFSESEASKYVLKLSEIELDPYGKVWIIDGEISSLLGEGLSGYLERNSATVFSFVDRLPGGKLWRVKEPDRRKEVEILSAILSYPDGEMRYHMSKLGRSLESTTPRVLLKIGIILILVVGLMVWMKIDPSLIKFKWPKSKQSKTFGTLLRVLGVEPFSGVRLLTLLLVFVSISVFLNAEYPLKLLVSKEKNVTSDKTWKTFNYSADYLVIDGYKGAEDTRVQMEGNFISNGPVYGGIDSQARPQLLEKRLLRVPGLKIGEDLIQVPSKYLGMDGESNQVFVSREGLGAGSADVRFSRDLLDQGLLESTKDLTIDVESVNGSEFIERESMRDGILSKILTTPSREKSSITISLKGLSEFGFFVYADKLDIVEIGVGGGSVSASDEVSIEGSDFDRHRYYHIKSNLIQLDQIQLKSDEGLAADWRVFGRRRNIGSGQCGDAYVLVDYLSIESWTRFDDCEMGVFLGRGNSLADMYTSDIFSMFVDTEPNVSTDILVTNTLMKPLPNSLYYFINIAEIYPGRLDFDGEFTINNLAIKYEQE